MRRVILAWLTSAVGRVLGYAFATFIGVFPAFFLVFKAIFSDVFSVFEHLMMFILVILAYGVLGLLFSFILPGPPWRWAIWLSLMAVLIVVWYSTYEVGQIPLNILYAVVTVVSAYVGTILGTQLSAKRKQGES